MPSDWQMEVAHPPWACPKYYRDFTLMAPHYWWECDECCEHRDETIYAEESRRWSVQRPHSGGSGPAGGTGEGHATLT